MGAGKPTRGMFPNAMAFARWGDQHNDRHVILIPGGPGNVLPSGWGLRLMGGVTRPLVDDGCTVWMVARRQNMPKGHSVEDMAADYADLIRTEFGGKVHAVVGLSFGGMIAQYLAANHADCFDRIVVALAACEVRNAHKDLEFAQLMSQGKRPEACLVMLESLFPGMRPSALKKVAARMMGRLSERGEHEHALQDILVEGEAEVAFDARPVLPTIEVPVLLLNGSADDYFPMDLIEETARLIPDCTSKIYEGKNHMKAATDKRLRQDIRDYVA